MRDFGIRIGRIAGIEVAADWSLLVIFALITAGLAGGILPSWHPDWGAGKIWSTALAAALAFLASILAHELSHALVGRRRGVAIRRITLFMFGGVAHMESEPSSWRAELVMAIVGPITSIALGVGFAVLAAILAGPVTIDPQSPQEGLADLGPLATIATWLAPLNVLLGLFNLVPGFPLDGGRVLRAILWATSGSLREATRRAARAGQAVALLLVALGVSMVVGLRVPILGTGFTSGIWLVLIGWFLNGAAVSSYGQMIVRQSLADVPVSRLMLTQLVRVPPDLPVATLVDELLMPSGQRAFPVESDGRLLGLVTLRDVVAAGRHAWEQMRVSELMRPAAELVAVEPRTSGVEALALLGRRDLNQLPVIEEGRLVGLFRRDDVVTFISLQAEGGLGRWRFR